MASTIRSRRRDNGGAAGPQLDEPHDMQDARSAVGDIDDAVLRQVVQQVHQQADRWRDMLTVSIGRARDLTELEETRIRYFEELGALQPTTSTGQSGASRLYTISDLRCLYALALLVKQHGYRPALAATLVKQHRLLIEHGLPESLGELVRREGSVITDGFLLARLMSQLIDAVQAQLDLSADAATSAIDNRPIRVVGVILPMQPLTTDMRELTPQYLQHMGRTYCGNPQNKLIALDRGTFFSGSAPAARAPGIRDDSTILFYSREGAWRLPENPRHRYCLYIPPAQPQLIMWLILDLDQGDQAPLTLKPCDTRRALIDRVLRLCELIFTQFQSSSLLKNYRYRSDGFQLEHSQQTYNDLLTSILRLIFPDPGYGVAALLIPNNLDRPTALAMLAGQGYGDDLVSRVKLDLAGEGQGLCGRAYNLREPFFSSDAAHDPRVAYAVEEHSCCALAVPLMSSWGIAPLGVLYLASRNPAQRLDSNDAYFALILGNILSEQLGRWWLTRLRKTQDRILHEQISTLVPWLGSLDPHGHDFMQAVDALQRLWEQIAAGELPATDSKLALIVFDIDRYRQNVQVRSNQPVPLKAQQHVRNAIGKILPGVRDYWFKNDHVLVILHNREALESVAIARRIAGQVRAVPADIQDKDARSITLTVSAAIKIMSYQAIRDLDPADAAGFRAQITAVIDDVRAQTAQSPAHTIHLLTPEGWQRA